MRINELEEIEEILLNNLDSGKYDGERIDNEQNGVEWGFFIDKGIPVKYNAGKQPKRFFDGKENTRAPRNLEYFRFETDEQKLYFFQAYGWLYEMFGNHPEVIEYSRHFKGKV